MYLYDKEGDKINLYEVTPNKEKIAAFKAQEIENVTPNDHYFLYVLSKDGGISESELSTISRNEFKKHWLNGDFDIKGNPDERYAFLDTSRSLFNRSFNHYRNCQEFEMRITKKLYMLHILLSEKVSTGYINECINKGVTQEEINELLDLFDFNFILEVPISTIEALKGLRVINTKGTKIEDSLILSKAKEGYARTRTKK